MHVDLADLVDERYTVDTAVKGLSVCMGLVKFTEAAYYLNVIAFETEVKHQAKAGEVGMCGSLIQSSSLGKPLTDEEEMLVEVFKVLPWENELTLQGCRRPSWGRQGLSQRKLNCLQWEKVCRLAQSLGLATIERRRAGPRSGRSQTILRKNTNLTPEARAAVRNLKLPDFIFA